MLKAYKYRIFPSEEQQNLLTNIFGLRPYGLSQNGFRNKPSVAQSDGLPCACNVKAHPISYAVGG